MEERLARSAGVPGRREIGQAQCWMSLCESTWNSTLCRSRRWVRGIASACPIAAGTLSGRDLGAALGCDLEVSPPCPRPVRLRLQDNSNAERLNADLLQEKFACYDKR